MSNHLSDEKETPRAQKFSVLGSVRPLCDGPHTLPSIRTHTRVPMLSAAHKETTGAVHTIPGRTDAGRWLRRLACKRITFHPLTVHQDRDGIMHV